MDGLRSLGSKTALSITTILSQVCIHHIYWYDAIAFYSYIPYYGNGQINLSSLPVKHIAPTVLTKALFPLAVLATVFLFHIGSASAQEEILGEATSFTESQQTLLTAKPAVTQVTNIITGNVIIQAVLASELGTPSLSGAVYPFELGLSGSGFFVTADGYLITNGHVANPDDELIAYYAIANTTEQIFKDSVAEVVYQYYGYDPSEDELETMYQQQLADSYGGDFWNLVDTFFAGYNAGELNVDDVQYRNFIQIGSISGSETLVEDLGKAATLIDSPYEGMSNSSDLAILKVDGSNFMTVPLGSFENVQIGSEVYAIGYPAIVEEYTGVFTDVSSGLEPSITSGIISAKKTLIDGTEAFQTDAGITHGNSGGPVLDSSGAVIGVTTWGFGDEPGGESFNFLISVENVESLLAKNNITPAMSMTTQKWDDALDLYSQHCYTNAKTEFEEVKALYPANVDVDDFISKSQAAIDRGEDVCLTPGESATLFVMVGGACACVVGLVVIVGLVVLLTRKKKAKTATPEQSTPTPADQQSKSAPVEQQSAKKD